MSVYEGACHCGSIRFQVETHLDNPVRCNCSFCVRRGALLQKVPADRFVLTSGGENLSRYGKRSFSDHFFCRHCGIHTFTKSSRNEEDAVVVNVGCLSGVDVNAYTPRVFDGAKLL